MILSTYISSKISKGKRLITSLVFGKQGAMESSEIMPFGVDSSPIKNMKAIYSDTVNNGTRCVIGYINTNQLSKAGEFRAFSAKNDGSLCTYIWLHAVSGDGQIEIGGTADNAVGYNQLQTQFNELNSKFNALVTVFNAHTHLYIPPLVPAPTTPIPTTPPPSPATASTADISQAKKTEIKTL